MSSIIKEFKLKINKSTNMFTITLQIMQISKSKEKSKGKIN